MGDMSAHRDLRLAILLAFGAAILTCLPYLVAAGLAPEHSIFGGFLMNPIDGFSYLAKMRQGYEGAWTFELPYAPNPGPASFVYVYYLLLGHVAAWTSLSPLIVYHLARALSAVLMFSMAFLLFRELLPDRKQVWTAYWLTLFGSGVGWLAIPAGVVASDLWIPESIPWLTAYVNPHFPLAAGAYLGAILAMVWSGSRPRIRALLALSCGFLLGAVLPFALAALVPIIAIWLIWELLEARRRGEEVNAGNLRTISPFAALLAGATPWLAYDFWLTRTQSSIGAWTSQNITPSPPPGEYLLGYGLVLSLALVGLAGAGLLRHREGRLLTTWMVGTVIVLYIPFGLQRRANLGLFFALAAMASYGIPFLTRGRVKANHVLALVLVLSVPSHLVVMMAGLAGVARGEPLLVISESDVGAFEWLADNASPGALVLAAPVNGNRLPAYAPVRVLYGHPMETPDADRQQALVESLYAWEGPDPRAIDLLRQTGVRYVFLGPEEREIGLPDWLHSLTIVYSSQGSEIFRMTPE